MAAREQVLAVYPNARFSKIVQVDPETRERITDGLCYCAVELPPVADGEYDSVTVLAVRGDEEAAWAAAAEQLAIRDIEPGKPMPLSGVFRRKMPSWSFVFGDDHDGAPQARGAAACRKDDPSARGLRAWPKSSRMRNLSGWSRWTAAVVAVATSGYPETMSGLRCARSASRRDGTNRSSTNESAKNHDDSLSRLSVSDR